MSKPKKEKTPASQIEPLNMSSQSRTRAEINETNRKRGKAVERQVAKLTGGERTPGSGAFKASNRNLTGDVEVKDAGGRSFLKLECKGVSTITPTGKKTYTLAKDVLDQAHQEAHVQHEIGVVWVHWHNGDYVDDYAIIKSDHFLELLRLAKLGSVIDRKGYDGSI